MVTQGLHFFCVVAFHIVCVCVLSFSEGFFSYMDYQASKERSWCFFYYIKHTQSGLEGTFRERVEGAVWEFPQMYNSKNEDSRSSRCCT